MPLKNTVAFERRIDLASLFCMIARHGPAVLLALAAIACLLAGFVIYRSVREKRRRRAAAAADDRDSSAGHRGAALGLWEEGEEEEPSADEIRTGSTDVSDESSPDDHKEDGYVSHRALQTVRHRRAAAERKPYKDKLPDRDFTSVDKAENAFVWDSNSHRATESFAEETRQNLQNDYTNRDVIEEVCGTKEPELMNDGEDEEKVLETDTSEDITTTNEDVSEEECKQDEDTVQSTFNSPLCLGPTPKLSGNDGKQDNTPETETKSLEPDFEKLEDSTVPGLKMEEISAAHIEDEDKIVDHRQNAIEQNMSMQCGGFSVVSHLNDKKQTDEPYNSTVEVNEECLILASHDEKCKSEPSDLIKVDTSIDDSILVTTDDVSVDAPDTTDITDLSSNSLQLSETQMSPMLAAEIDQSGLCLQEPSQHEKEVQTDTNQSDSQKAFEIVTSDASEKDFPITVADDSNSICIVEAVLHPSEINKAEDESVEHQEPAEKVETETSTLPEGASLQHQLCQEIMPQVQDRDQAHEDNLSDQKDNTDKEQQSQSIYNENNLNTVDQVAGQSALAASKPEECLVLLPASQSEPTDLIQQETSLSGFATKAEISSITEITVSSNGQKEHEVTPNLDSNTENILPPLLPSQISEHENNQDDQKDVSSDTFEASATICNNIAACIIKQAVAEVCLPEETAVEAETNSSQLEENKSSEQLGQLNVRPVQDNDSIDHDNLASEPIQKNTENVFEQAESEEGVVCSNMTAQIEEETGITGSCLEVRELMEVEGEKESLSDIKTDILEITATSNEFEQLSEVNEPGMLLDVEIDFSNKCESEVGNFPLTKVEGEQESLSAIKTDILETTATFNELELQSEQKEPEMLLDTDKELLKSESDDCQRVIVCETFEGSVSAVQVPESEKALIDNTSHFELASSNQISTCQYHKENSETPAEEVFSADIVTSNSVALAAPPVIDRTAQTEMPSSSPDQQNDHAESNMHFEMTSGAVLDFTQGKDPCMKSLEQIELKDNDVSSPGLESGISSMTVSPEVEEASEEIGLIVEGNLPPERDPMLIPYDTLAICEVLHSEKKVSHSLFTNDVVVSVTKEDEVTVVIGPLASSPVQLSSPEYISDESLVTNEDSFGSEIEDSYQKAMEELMLQVVDNVMNRSREMATQIEQKIVKVDEKKEQACVGNKEEGEKVVDSEKTEISIMEATMDHNEWIIDGSYQVLPWMNAPCFSKDNTTSKETKDVAENKPPAHTPTAEENTENAKKVLAVQPMPQNVNVTFRVHYLTLSPFQTVAVTGDQQELGGWKSVVPLEKSKDGYWSCVVSLPAESHVEWKFVVLDKGEVCRWEECGNRLLYTGYGDDLLVHKWWGFM